MSAGESPTHEIETLKSALAEARRRLEEFQTIFDSMPIMFWYKDRENRHIRVNKAAAALEGLSSDAIEGKSAYELYPPEQAAAFHKDDLEVIHSGIPKLGIVEKHTAPSTGKQIWLQTGKVPYRDPDGNIIGVIAFAVDITDQKRAEEALQQAHDHLERQNQKLARAHEFMRSNLEHLTEIVERSATQREVFDSIQNMRAEFDRLEK